MKLFFELRAPTSDGDALRQAEEGFVARLATAAPNQVVFSPGEADVIIHAATEQYNSAPVAQLMRPLSRGDVERFVWDWGDNPTGRYSGFYCSLDRRLFDPRRHRTACYPIAFNELVDEFSQTDTIYDYGFLGGLSAGVRRRIFTILGPRQQQDNAFLKEQGADWSTTFVQSATDRKREFVDLLRSVKFVLCPRGQGTGSVRLFETMKAGRVPIIISDGYVLPAGVDWDRCSLRVSERNIDAIPALVAANLARWPDMARAARKAWTEHFAEDRLVPRLCEDIEALRASVPDVGPGAKLAYSARMAMNVAEFRLRPALGRARQALTRWPAGGSPRPRSVAHG